MSIKNIIPLALLSLVSVFATGCAESADARLLVEARMTCDDGGTFYYESDRCNLEDDCDDGSDEAGCEDYQCEGNDYVTRYDLCDGTEDCDDGADEVDCDV